MEDNKISPSLANAFDSFSNKFIRLQLNEDKSSFVFSPWSLEVAFGMVLLGIKQDSQEVKELLDVLGFSQSDKTVEGQSVINDLKTFHKMVAAIQAPEFKMKCGNVMFFNDSVASVESEYSKRLDENFDGKVEYYNPESADKAASRINQWVSSLTENMITEIVQPSVLSDPESVFVLVNAVYLNGKWLDKFQKEATALDGFKNNGIESTTKMVDFMNANDDFHYYETSCDDLSEKQPFKALALPFSYNEGNEFQMLVVLPNNPDGLEKLMINLNMDLVNEISHKLRKVEVKVKIPKFTIESNYSNLTGMLSTMGLSGLLEYSDTFEPMITTPRQVKISDVVHKAKIKVDEEGAEAAAATAIQVRMCCAMIMPEPKRFIANHPFAFIVQHKATNLPLFVGAVMNFD